MKPVEKFASWVILAIIGIAFLQVPISFRVLIVPLTHSRTHSDPFMNPWSWSWSWSVKNLDDKNTKQQLLLQLQLLQQQQWGNFVRGYGPGNNN